MADDSDQGEKTEEPSQHRIDEFRKKGEVAASKELASVLVLLACILTLSLSVAFIYESLKEYVEWLYTLDVANAYTQESLKTILAKSLMLALKCVGPIFIVSFIIGIFSHIAQIGFIFAPEAMSLKLERLNPVKGAKNLLSLKSVVNAIKGIFKFIIIMSIVYLFFRDKIDTYKGFFHVEFFQAFLYAKDLLAQLAFSIVLGLVVVAIGDFAWEKYQYKRKLMMTKEQAKREHKEKEGNPEVKQRIRAIQREMSQKRMMQDIPKADVIVTNPTHISVALKYDPEKMISPQVIAKGADHLAMRIRKIAKEHDIPMVENVPLARTLYKTVKLGHAVPRDLYKAVAEVLAFVYKLKRKKKAVS